MRNSESGTSQPQPNILVVDPQLPLAISIRLSRLEFAEALKADQRQLHFATSNLARAVKELVL